MARTPWLVSFSIAASLATATTRAEAMGAVVGRSGQDVAVGSARIAVAAAPSRTTRWAQVSVAGGSAGFAWLVPVPPGGRIDYASDAWLDALDAATAPIVLPPAAPDSCDAGSAPERISPRTTPVSLLPSQSALFADAATLGAYLTGAGYLVSADLQARLESGFAAGGSVLAAIYDATDAAGDVSTRALRIVDDGAPTLSLGVAPGTPVTAFVLGAARGEIGAAPLTIDPSTVLWNGDGQSTYLAERDALLSLTSGARWLTEGALPDLFFEGATAPDAGAIALPSVLGEYFTLARSYGDSLPDPGVCAAAASTLRASATPFAAACAPGLLGIAPGPNACLEEDDAGAATDSMRCGSADDAVFAVASLSAASLWTTRFEGIAPSAPAADLPVAIAARAPVSPIVTAGAYSASCSPAPAPPTPPITAPTPPPPPASAPPTSDPPPSSDPSASDVAPAVAEGCGAAIADSCSGDSSSSDESDDSGGCDSHSEHSDDESSSGGCGSSSSSDSSSSSCTTAARNRGRRGSPVSRILMTCVAVAALARRRGARRTARA